LAELQTYVRESEARVMRRVDDLASFEERDNRLQARVAECEALVDKDAMQRQFRALEARLEKREADLADRIRELTERLVTLEKVIDELLARPAANAYERPRPEIRRGPAKARGAVRANSPQRIASAMRSERSRNRETTIRRTSTQ